MSLEKRQKLQKLLVSVKDALQAKQSKDSEDNLAGQTEEVLFTKDSDTEEENDTNQPSTISNQRPKKKNSSKQPISFSSLLAKPVDKDIFLHSSPNDRMEGTSKSAEQAGKGELWGKGPLVPKSKKQRQEGKAKTAGSKWFDLAAPEMTAEVKRELQAHQLRYSLDPKRFYKGGVRDSKKIPEFFAFGHIIQSGSGRATTSTNHIANPKKRTFVEELMEDEEAKRYTVKKTKEIMERGMSGRRGKAKTRGRGSGRR